MCVYNLSDILQICRYRFLSKHDYVTFGFLLLHSQIRLSSVMFMFMRSTQGVETFRSIF